MSEKLSIGKRKLLEYLGDEYTTKIVDGELCVYIDLGDYDIEIAGGYRSRDSFEIYVWRRKGGLEIVERHFKVRNNYPAVKALLDNIRYRHRRGGGRTEPYGLCLRTIRQATVGYKDGMPNPFCYWCIEDLSDICHTRFAFFKQMDRDTNFPKTSRSKAMIKRYLKSIGALEWEMDTFEELWDDYEHEELKAK